LFTDLASDLYFVLFFGLKLMRFLEVWGVFPVFSKILTQYNIKY
jgi:hypothetical protein